MLVICHQQPGLQLQHSCGLAACRVFQAAFAASPLHLLRIFCVAATERPATRGCGLPKFHSQVLTSYTWLPLRDPWRGPSAQPNAKSRLCRAAYLYGIVEVMFPSRKHGNSGTLPRISSTLPTESRNRGGLVKLSDSPTFHGTSHAKQKVLKGTKKN